MVIYHMHAQIGLLSVTQGNVYANFWAFFCLVFSSPELCRQILAALTFNSNVCFFNPTGQLGSVLFSFFSYHVWFRNCLQTEENLCNCSSYLFPFSWESQSCSSSCSWVVQWLTKFVSYILTSFLVVHNRIASPIAILPSWTDVEGKDH